ncbi:MAG TPA: hypothetical protein VIX81_12445, partial [Gammaproteobacteria bacterium]
MRKQTLLHCRRVGGTLARAVALVLLLPAAAGASEEWDIAGFVENDTHFRDGRGLAKFRNTAQLEFSRGLRSEGRISNLRLKGTLRATYDGVYDLNDDEFGDKAGGPVMMESLGGPIPPPFQPVFGGLTDIAPGPVEYAGVGAPPNPPPPTLNP